MPLCPRCSKRAAKRFCPALKTKICAVCCAEERMIELACPESCQYLRAARPAARDREQEMRVRETMAQVGMVTEIDKRGLVVVYAIDGAIVSLHRGAGG